MKKVLITITFLLFAIVIFAQPIIDAGVKAGVNNSKLTANRDEFNSESIVKMHVGAFARLGYGRVYLQPEVYFSAKGGELESSISSMITKFDFNNVDVPLLLGVKVINGGVANLRIMAGPVFSFMTSNDVKGEPRFTRQYFRDHYFGYQYGAGVDVWKFFLDARMEHGTNTLYAHPDLNSQNRTFMVTVGFKFI